MSNEGARIANPKSEIRCILRSPESFRASSILLAAKTRKSRKMESAAEMKGSSPENGNLVVDARAKHSEFPARPLYDPFKGKSDAVKQQYWLYVAMQKQRN